MSTKMRTHHDLRDGQEEISPELVVWVVHSQRVLTEVVDGPTSLGETMSHSNQPHMRLRHLVLPHLDHSELKRQHTVDATNHGVPAEQHGVRSSLSLDKREDATYDAAQRGIPNAATTSDTHLCARQAVVHDSDANRIQNCSEHSLS